MEEKIYLKIFSTETAGITSSLSKSIPLYLSLIFCFLSSVVLSFTLFLFISTLPFLWNLYLSCYFHNEKTINQRLRSYPTVYGFLINRLIFYLYTIAWNWWYALWILEFRKTIAFHICHSYTWVHRCPFDS